MIFRICSKYQPDRPLAHEITLALADCERNHGTRPTRIGVRTGDDAPQSVDGVPVEVNDTGLYLHANEFVLVFEDATPQPPQIDAAPVESGDVAQMSLFEV